MGRVKELSNAFLKDNYGVFDHEGCVRVANGDSKQRIIYINDNGTVLVYSNKKTKSFVARIHNDLRPYMKYCQESDTAFIKYRNDGAWIVGFQIKKDRFISEVIKSENKDYTLDNGVDLDFISYFKRHKELSDLFPNYEGVCP